MDSSSQGCKYLNTTSSLTRITEFSLQQRKKLAEEAEFECIHDPALNKLGSDAASTFREILRQRYGNCVRGWRRILDPSGRGEVSFSDFSAALQELCFKSGAKATWKELGGFETGFIKLVHLHEKADKVLRAVQSAFERQETTLKAVCESKESLSISKEAFREACKPIKPPIKHPDTVFDLLRLGDGYVTLEDAQWLENHCKPPPEPVDYFALRAQDKKSKSMELRLEAVNTRKKQVEDSKAPWQQEKESEPKKPQVGELRRLLRKKWGNCARAWWLEFDPDHMELVPQADFLNKLENVPYKDDTSVLWDQLVPKGDVVTIDHIDPHVLKALENFKRCCISRDGSVEHAFSHCPARWKPLVEKREFLFWCLEVGLEEKHNSGLLADYLDRFNVGALTMEWIDSEAAVKVFGRQLLDDVLDQLRQRDQVVRPSPRITLVERQKVPHRISVEADLNVEKSMARGKEAFLAMLEAKFGSIIRAWRRVLDCNGDGQLSRGEFFSGISAVGYTGNAEELWLQFETDLTGNLTLDDMSPESKEDCIEFHDLCEEAYESLALAFDHADNDGSGEIKFMEFCKLCRDIGYRGDMDRMFAHLDVDGSGEIAFEEIQFLELVKHGSISELLAQEFAKRQEEKARLRGKDRTHPNIVVVQQNRLIRRAREKRRRWKEAEEVKGEFFKGMCDTHKIRSSRGWHLLLDPDNKGVVRYQDLAKAAKASKFEGDIDLLWKRFDPEGEGEVKADSIFPSAHKELLQFQQSLIDFYGSLDDAFHTVDKDGTLRLDEKGFREWCRQVEFKGNEKRLFFYLDKTGAGQISLGSIDEFTFEDCFEDADLDVASGEVRKIPGWEDPITNHLGKLKHARDVKKIETIRSHERKEFQNVLIRRCGTLVAAWKELAGSSKTEMTFGDFRNVLEKKLQFEGDHTLLWRSLLGNGVEQKETLSIHDVEPQIEGDLDSFKQCLKSRWGNLEDAFEYIDLHETGTLSPADFRYVCHECEFRGNEKRLFEYIDAKSRGKIKLEDIDGDAAHAMERTRAKAGHAATTRRQFREAFPKTVPPVGEPGGEPAFKNFLHFLEHKYGTIFNSWRRALDFDEKGLLNYNEFRKGCYALGFAGNIRNIWTWLESSDAVDADGFISLRALDPKAFDLLDRFRTCCLKRLGSMKKVLADRKGQVNVRLERTEFKNLFRAIKCSVSWERVYAMLDPQSVGSVTWSDIRFLEGWGKRTEFGKRCDERSKMSPSKDRLEEGPMQLHVKARIVQLQKSQSLPELKTGSFKSMGSTSPGKAKGSMSPQLKAKGSMSPQLKRSPQKSDGSSMPSPLRNTWNHRHQIKDTLANKTEQMLFELNYVDQTTQAAFQRKVQKNAKGKTLQEFLKHAQEFSQTIQTEPVWD